MSETWYGIFEKDGKLFEVVNDVPDPLDVYVKELEEMGYEFREVEVPSLREEPCEWEKESAKEFNTSHSNFLILINHEYEYCPKCGRRLRKEQS